MMLNTYLSSSSCQAEEVGSGVQSQAWLNSGLKARLAYVRLLSRKIKNKQGCECSSMLAPLG